MEITVGYDSDIPKAMELMKRICAGNMLTLNTMENKVFVKGYSADGVILKTTVWTKNLNDSFQACSELRLDLVQYPVNDQLLYRLAWALTGTIREHPQNLDEAILIYLKLQFV